MTSTAKTSCLFLVVIIVLVAPLYYLFFGGLSGPAERFDGVVWRAAIKLDSDIVCLKPANKAQAEAIAAGQAPYDDIGQLKRGLSFVTPDEIPEGQTAICYQKHRPVYNPSEWQRDIFNEKEFDTVDAQFKITPEN